MRSFQFAQVLLASAIVVSADPYCTFYADKDCTQQVGSVAYDVTNSGCFQNSGGFIKCSDGTTPFTLVQSPGSDQNCYCQSDCIAFPRDFSSRDPYSVCVPINEDPQYQDFRIIQNGECGANNC